MKSLISYHILLILFFLSEMTFAQKQQLTEYYLIKRNYENREENDSTALSLVADYIRKAKQQKDNARLFEGYNDALLFSPQPGMKLKYADSIIYAAKASGSKHLLSSAYLSKGVVYYFHFKNYRLALDEYLKAYQLSVGGEEFLQRRIQYLIGVVKNHIGLYDGALVELNEAERYFECQIKKDIHPNEMYNNLRGYYNTVHQLSVCHRQLKNFKKADSLVSVGLRETYKNPDFKQEHGYFLKESGIMKYYQRDYLRSIELLENSIQEIRDVKDFGWTAIAYSYIGKAYLALGNVDESMMYFTKVDSISKKQGYYFLDATEVYPHLISYHQRKNNPEKVSYFLERLLTNQNAIREDLNYMAQKVHGGYDSEKRYREMAALEQKKLSAIKLWSIFGLALVCTLLLFFYFRIEKRRKGDKFGNTAVFQGIRGAGSVEAKQNKAGPKIEIVDDILKKLEQFEDNEVFLDKNINVYTTAMQLGVSPTYLSNVVNDRLGISFTRYINELRIAYVTEKICYDQNYHKFKIETLAKECGISSRTNFSNLFYAINGIRPNEFIKMRKEFYNNSDCGKG